MGSRQHRQDAKFAQGVAQLVLFVGFIALWFPAVRQMLYKLGLFLTWGAIITCVVALGVYLIRRTERRSPFSSDTSTTLDVSVAPSQRIERSFAAPTTSPFQRTNPTRVTPAPERVRTVPTANLIEQLRSIDWFQFEKVVALVYRKLGYSVTRCGGANPDGGIDLIIEKDGQRSAVQCKQWKTWKVGVKSVREFLGALTHAKIQKGIFITLNGYSGDAKRLADEHGIEIVNQTGLARMLESTDAKFDPEMLSILNDKRKFCPKCEREMLLRTAKKGLGVGRQFWGCSAYPKCRFTMPLQ